MLRCILTIFKSKTKTNLQTFTTLTKRIIQRINLTSSPLVPAPLISFKSLECAALSLLWDTFTCFPSAWNVLSSTLQLANSSSLQYFNLNIITPTTFPDHLIWNWSPLFTSPSFCAFLSWCFITFCNYLLISLPTCLTTRVYNVIYIIQYSFGCKEQKFSLACLNWKRG